MEKTLVIQDNPKQPTFLFREDYLFFGLLVRHGLVAPTDYRALVKAQHDFPGKKPLMELLCEANNLTGKARTDMEELLRVLANPKLRDLLPNEMPAMQTLIEEAEATLMNSTDGYADPDATVPSRIATDATEVDVANNPATPKQKISSSNLLDTRRLYGSSHIDANLSFESISATYLSKEETDRIQTARVKSHMVGQVLAGNILIDRLGSGGQGDVYLAKQLSLNRYVALKKLEIPRTMNPEAFINAFREEAQTLGRINHARIVKVYEIFQEGSDAFFTMEYLAGKTLRDLVVTSGGPLPLEIVANLACQSCSALGRTAEDGLVHRDIKPANMMLDENGDLKIVDFGLAGLAENFAGTETNFAGTPQFASPEQVQRRPLTALSDQYSLGMTLYYTLTGDVPFKSSRYQEVLQMQVDVVPPAPSVVNPQLPKEVDRVVMRMLEKDPAKRFATFDECFSAWQKLLELGSMGKLAGSKQLLGDSLLRFSREEKNKVVIQSCILLAAWGIAAAGTILAEFKLRAAGMGWVLDASGRWGTYLLVFSLSCIFYVAAARRGWLPVIGSLRTWLYTHITTAVISVALIMLHSGNFLYGIAPGPPQAKPLLSLLMASILLITAISGSVGLLIFRGLRRLLNIRELQLRGTAVSPREEMMTVLSAQLLSGWRLVHYPLAIFFMMLTVLHILQTLRFGWE